MRGVAAISIKYGGYYGGKYLGRSNPFWIDLEQDIFPVWIDLEQRSIRLENISYKIFPFGSIS